MEVIRVARSQLMEKRGISPLKLEMKPVYNL
jgi:hypothetical protein